MQNRKSTRVHEIMSLIIFLTAFLIGLLFGISAYTTSFRLVVSTAAIPIGFLVGYLVFCVTLIAILAVRAYALSLASQSREETHACRCGNYPNRPDRGGGVLHSSPNQNVRPDPSA